MSRVQFGNYHNPQIVSGKVTADRIGSFKNSIEMTQSNEQRQAPEGVRKMNVVRFTHLGGDLYDSYSSEKTVLSVKKSNDDLYNKLIDSGFKS